MTVTPERICCAIRQAQARAGLLDARHPTWAELIYRLDGRDRKFYRLHVVNLPNGCQALVAEWGRAGSTGQMNVLGTWEGSAAPFAEKKIASKIKKGYEVVRERQESFTPWESEAPRQVAGERQAPPMWDARRRFQMVGTM